jgi:hypothetical protein
MVMVIFLFTTILITNIEAAPEIVFQVNTYDFGKLIYGDTAVCSFPFTNVGDSTLSILDVRSTCGCAVVDLKQYHYEPGKGGEITVIF